MKSAAEAASDAGAGERGAGIREVTWREEETFRTLLEVRQAGMGPPGKGPCRQIWALKHPKRKPWRCRSGAGAGPHASGERDREERRNRAHGESQLEEIQGKKGHGRRQRSQELLRGERSAVHAVQQQG